MSSEAPGNTVLWVLAVGLVLAALLVVVVAMRPPEGAPPSRTAMDDAPRLPRTAELPPEPIVPEVAIHRPRPDERPPAPPEVPNPSPVPAESLDDRGVVVPAPLPAAAAIEALGTRTLVPTAVLQQHGLVIDLDALPSNPSKTREERQLEVFAQAYERLGVRLERMRTKLAEAERIGDLAETAELRPRVRELEQNRERIGAQVAELRAAVEQQRAATATEGTGTSGPREPDPSPHVPRGEATGTPR